MLACNLRANLAMTLKLSAIVRKLSLDSAEVDVYGNMGLIDCEQAISIPLHSTIGQCAGP